MVNLACCFDAVGLQEDGNCSKELHALLRFYVANLSKISPRFSEAFNVTWFELDKSA